VNRDREDALVVGAAEGGERAIKTTPVRARPTTKFV
jgi:hypothetical protein